MFGKDSAVCVLTKLIGNQKTLYDIQDKLAKEDAKLIPEPTRDLFAMNDADWELAAASIDRWRARNAPDGA